MTEGEQGGGAAERWLRVIPSLRDPQLRIRFVRTELEVLGLAEAAGALEAIAASTEQTDPRAREVLIAAAPTLTDPAKPCAPRLPGKDTSPSAACSAVAFPRTRGRPRRPSRRWPCPRGGVR
jgi:hypothetical protein